MKIELNMVSIINITGLINGLFLSVVFYFSKKGKIIINRMLALLVFSLSMITLTALLWSSNTYLKYPELLGILKEL